MTESNSDEPIDPRIEAASRESGERFAKAFHYSPISNIEDLELRFVRQDGSVGRRIVANHLITISAERYGLVTMIDITERKRMEQSLRDSQARLEAAIDGGGMGAWTREISRREMWWDDASLRLWGRPADEPHILSREEVMHPSR